MLCTYGSLLFSGPFSSPKQLPPAQNLTLNVNTQCHNYANQNPTISQNGSQKMDHNHTNTVGLSDLKNSVPKKIKEYCNNLYKYKWYSLGFSVTAIYIFINMKIYQINKLLENPKSWCLWKEEIPLTRLISIDSKELLKQLKLDICKKYFNAVNTIKDSELVILFLDEITKEKELLELYQYIYDVTSQLYLSRLLITSKSKEQITQYAARLNFLMDLYLEKYIQTNNTFNND